MRRHTTLLPAVVVLVVVSTVSGCGGDDDAASADTSAATSGPVASEPSSIEPVALPVAFDPWVRMPAVGQTVAAAYVTFVNTSDSDIALLDVSSPVAEAELHETVTDDEGVMRMQPRPQGFVVPASGELVFAPGGAHVMLFDVDVLALATAQEVELSFDFGPLGLVTVMAEVRGELPALEPDDGNRGGMNHGDGGEAHDHGGHHHDGHDHDGHDHDGHDHDGHGTADGLDAYAWKVHELDDELHVGVYEPERQRKFVAGFRAALLGAEVPAGFDRDGLVAVLDELDAALEAGDVKAAAALAFRAHDLAHDLIPH
jgi:periplasmic copper chaperone A